MAYRTSQPLHPTEDGKPKRRTVTKKKRVYIDKGFKPNLRGETQKKTTTKTRPKKTIYKTKTREINVFPDDTNYRNTVMDRNAVRKKKITVKGNQEKIKVKSSVRSKGKIRPSTQLRRRE